MTPPGTAKLRHIAIAVPDLEAAAAFYENAFGLERVGRTARRIHLSDGTVNLTLLPSDDLAGDPRGRFTGLHHVGILVDDVAAAGGRIEANGGRPVDVPESYVATNAERKYWDLNGVMIDVAAMPWATAKPGR